MSLDSLLHSARDLKFIFVGGKGGVGKTTSSSAIATLLSQVSPFLFAVYTPLLEGCNGATFAGV